MPSLVFWIYTYSSRKKLFPPSSLNDQLFNHHSLFELLFPRINNVHASNILLCYVLWYRLYGIIMYNRMVCYYFSSSSSLFLFLRYIALDSCVGRARSLLNSRPGPTSSLSLSLSLYPYLLARKYKECDCILSSIVYHRDYLVVISHILSRKLHTHTIKHTLSLTFLSLNSSGYTRTRLVALTTRPLLYLITITHYTFTYRFRG